MAPKLLPMRKNAGSGSGHHLSFPSSETGLTFSKGRSKWKRVKLRIERSPVDHSPIHNI